MEGSDPKVFKLALKIADCKPEEIIFIDDGFNNVRSARVLGINSIRFIGLDNLVEEIQKFDIKVD
jgi:FMN phosphatase YigB (HAD superfamily)